MQNNFFSIKNLCVSAGDTQILHDISFSFSAGKTYVLMGPNGSGKSTFAAAIMGSPSVSVTSGSVYLQDEDITSASPDYLAKKGLYLGFQHPVEVGVGMVPFVRSVLASKELPVSHHDVFIKDIELTLARVGLAKDAIVRNVNERFSGGEKKRNELFQLSLFQPRIAIMDEIDSGLDVDGVSLVCKELSAFTDGGGTLLLITHSGAFARNFDIDTVYIMKDGRIVKTGGKEIISFIESHGFEPL